MSKPKITITIDGPQGSGKSTLARYLASVLQHDNGVTTTLNDGGRLMPEHREELAHYFRTNVTINVEQK